MRKKNTDRIEFEKQTLFKLNSRWDVKPITDGHKELIDSIDNCTIILCSGPAGSGKTHIALGKGIEGLRKEKFKQVLLIRPLQECGRNIGALPGEKDEKLSVHMLAFTDLFNKFMTSKEAEEWIKNQNLVIDSPEFIRGRTFNETYIVLDEAQNLTYTQLKMLMTRIGKDSKMVIVGDAQQTDLPKKFWFGYDSCEFTAKVPLAEIMDRLTDVDDKIEVIDLTEEDIVRHDLIAKLCKIL